MNYIFNFHIELSLFVFRVNLSAQTPIAAVNINAIVAIALISGDIPDLSIANINTGKVAL